jgi:hypothetical protein
MLSIVFSVSRSCSSKCTDRHTASNSTFKLPRPYSSGRVSDQNAVALINACKKNKCNSIDMKKLRTGELVVIVTHTSYASREAGHELLSQSIQCIHEFCDTCHISKHISGIQQIISSGLFMALIRYKYHRKHFGSSMADVDGTCSASVNSKMSHDRRLRLRYNHADQILLAIVAFLLAGVTE